MCLSAYVTNTPIATIWRCGKYNREGCPAVCDRQMYFRISKKNSPGYSGSAQICYQIRNKHGIFHFEEWEIEYPTQTENKLPPTLSLNHQRILMRHLLEQPTPQNIGVLLALCTGMRIGEVCALKWEDVDFAQKTVIVKHTVGRIYNCELKSTERVHSSPKTKNSYREIPISKQLLQALKMVRKQSQSPYVVGTSTQSKEPRSYRDYFGRLLKRLDIPHLVFHGLRHTFATRCIESQCDYKTVSVILGHSNVATTLNLYVHPNLNQKKRCIDRMSNFLGIT